MTLTPDAHLRLSSSSKASPNWGDAAAPPSKLRLASSPTSLDTLKVHLVRHDRDIALPSDAKVERWLDKCREGDRMRRSTAPAAVKGKAKARATL
mmetsp:Transcript_14178/g.42427  ORF Transcript_14178/g.42427 Transcript_14178/m.42427 type:complete len:95 (+) Transcript_14178:3322-3606(+)